MATLNRHPLMSRHAHQITTIAPSNKPQRTVSGNKRARSPEPLAELPMLLQNSKRVKSVDPPPSLARDKARERKHMEREQQKVEFKEKYTRAFPSFTFYFDELNITSEEQDFLEESIEKLGGKIVKFLDKTVTHFISNRAENTQLSDKENMHKSGGILKSPIKLKNRFGKSENGNPALLSATLEHKVWNSTKLESVLQRLIDPLTATPSGPFSTSKKQTLSLERLLKYEQRNGTTERDPTQKRHDFKYFTRGSRFVLIEDIREELATIAVHEYPQSKSKDGVTQTPWPVLHCHPQSRGPFIVFDDKERRRWEKLQRAEREQKAERKKHTNKVQQAELQKRRAEANLYVKHAGDLRRSVSMSNLHRRTAYSHVLNDEFMVDIDEDGENLDSAVASGFLLSVAGTAGYMAASGNSVGITSTTETTSTAGYTSRLRLPPTFSGRMKHIVTSRKFPSAAADKENEVPSMGPPSIIPERKQLLRKSRSTNTLKLPKREEGSKPGYCESCRTKFNDFKEHTNTDRKHQRFATNAANFLQLDCVLARVQRRTKAEIADIRMQRDTARRHRFDSIRIRAQVPSDQSLPHL
ncbi:hypothetical protein C0992_006143 [Termitomyces sp. T32_za158]|nr:hypothetical protein C0992_006143 [Termitomyces sp. T32_za158]